MGKKRGIDVNHREAGLLIPVFALKREGDFKIGDTDSFKDAIDFCARNGIKVLQTLPINETSGDNSPYNAISSMALEPVLLSMQPDVVPGLSAADHALVKEEIAALDDEVIDYRSIKLLKQKLLRKAYDAVLSDSGKKLQSAFERFKKERSAWLDPYALFRALIELNGGSPVWPSWPEEQQSFLAARKWVESASNRKEIERLEDFFKFVQWVADSQWQAVKAHADKMNVRLMGDVPFGVSRYSSDVWFEQSLFQLELSGGAPPEPVFAGDEFTKRWGQNWGIPLYHWEVHRKENFRWWRSRITRLLEHFHDFRIDHVLGFFRVYAFPWTPDRNEEFLHLTDTEAMVHTDGILPRFEPRDDETADNRRLNKVEGYKVLSEISDAAGDGCIVAEDLGLIVPPYVRPTIHELNMAGFAIPIFERDEETREFVPMEDLNPLSLATYATHDHQPIRAYYEGLVKWWHSENGHEGWLEVQRLMRLLGRDEDSAPTEFTDEILFAFEKALLQSPCWLAVMMITDLLGLGLRFNMPGKSGGECWTARLDRDLKSYEADEQFGSRIKAFRKLILETGRAQEKVGAGSL
ncbi:MAG: 4-alpha-glucanotransferase [Cyanobacteriota/Melainabacteria group bacterium]